MESLGPMADVIKADPRPTIVIDLKDPVTKDVFKFSSCNEALLNRAGVRDELFRMDSASTDFLEWIQAEGNFDPGEAFGFGGLKWIKFTVTARWRIVSCTTPFQEIVEEGQGPLVLVSQDQVALPLQTTSDAPLEVVITTPAELTPSLPAVVPSRPDISSPRAHSEADISHIQTAELPGQLGGWTDNFHQLLKVMMKDDRIAKMTTIGMFDFLPNGKLLQANDCWYDTSGHPRDPAKATEFSFMKCVYEEDKELVMDSWNTLSNGIPVTFEMRWKAKTLEEAENSNSIFEAGFHPTWISAACVPFMADDGTLISISGFTTNIMAKKESEQHLLDRAAAVERAELSEKRFATFAKLAPVAIWVLDPQYQITYGNDKWFDTVGSPRVPYNELRWVDFILPEDLSVIMGGLKRLTEEKVPQSFEFRLNKLWDGGDGISGETWMSSSGYPDFDENGNIKEVLGTMTDVSRYKWAESVQKQKVNEVLELKRQQENFIDMTSHEIRNPISAVVQSADLISTSLYEMTAIIESSLPSAQIQEAKELTGLIESSLEATQTIIACSIHQKRIVDDILTLSKLDSRLLLITPVKVQAVSVIKDTLKMSKAEAQVAYVEISYTEHESLKRLDVDWVMMDSSRVLQIFVNLLTNAIKFTQTEVIREINVTVRASVNSPLEDEGYIPTKTPSDDITESEEWGHGDIIYLHFIVSDTGRGLTPEEMSKMFFRFSQASPRTHVEYGGSGLGLSVSRELAELQGGQIRVTSEYRRGSTFAFYIKCRKAEPGDVKDNVVTRLNSVKYGMHSPRRGGSVFVMPAQEPFSLKGYRVLLVEDNLVNQRVLRKQLEKINAVVDVAGDGIEALEKIEHTIWRKGEESLDVVLMDLEMPVMGGLECVQKIREMEKSGEIQGHLPVIVVSANARSKQIEQAEESGSDDFVGKPFRIGELVPKIVALVATPRGSPKAREGI